MNGSGQIISRPITVADFTRVTVQGPFNIEVDQADQFGVTISTDDNLISRVQFTREEETLTIGIQAAANFFPTKLQVKIGMPRIYTLNLSGDAKAVLNGFNSTYNFELDMSGGSTLTGNIVAGNDDFNISGASQINLQGTALSLNLDVYRRQ